MIEASGKTRPDRLITGRRHCGLCYPFGVVGCSRSRTQQFGSVKRRRRSESLTTWRRRCLTPHSVPVRWFPQSGLAFCPSVRSRVPLTDRGLRNKGSANWAGKPRSFGLCRCLSHTHRLGVAAAVVTSLPLLLFSPFPLVRAHIQGP